jgi:RHS repeat-associated protein
VLLLVLSGNFYAVADKITYVHTDVLGSPVAETDESGNIIWTEHYSPFGEKVDNLEESIDNSVGYTGHQHDSDTGLTYMQARYYDPVIGRFYSNDPIGFRDIHSFNRYAYANNNPYKYIDPTGEASFLVSRPLKGAAGLVASHNFIVSNADYVGDPNATVHSFGKNNDGNMGRVDENTTGFSEGTQATDSSAWTALSSLDDDLGDSITQIFASDEAVDQAANSLVENKEYGVFGVNSNSGASAVANTAQGSEVELPSNLRAAPGASNSDKVEFKKPEEN